MLQLHGKYILWRFLTDSPVRVIDAFVDGLDLVEAGFSKALLNKTGRPPYDPRDLLKLYIYGYFNRIRSSRRPHDGMQPKYGAVFSA